jgi:alanine racemase
MFPHESLKGLRPTWVEVDLKILESNYRVVRSFLPREVRIIAVVKAHGYGHGVIPVAQVLAKAGVDAFAVAILEEALVLRNTGISSPIVLLNGFWEGQEEEIIRHQLIPTVYNQEMLLRLEAAASHLRETCSFHLKVNTGMSRLGIDWEEGGAFLQKCSQYRWAHCNGIYTHFSCAEDIRSLSIRRQLNHFKDLLKQTGQTPRWSWCHAANSAAMINFRESWFNAVRPGLILYGINPIGIQEGEAVPHPGEESWKGVLASLRPVLSFKTRVAQLRMVKRGKAIGYGDTYITPRDSRIATLPVGYADGLMRTLSNKGAVLVRGQRAPIVGRISMDLSTIDVSNATGVEIGDEVALIGQQGAEEIGATEMAALAGTIPYEILCRIGGRVTRIYRS